MDFNVLWFILISVLFTGFFFLEGFDYGVGTLLPFLGKNDRQRRMIINSIGPFWDGNEVWLITAGGAMFAAFPDWYATMFSGFYLALVLMLLMLILRGVAFEFRSKNELPAWRNVWDILLCLGSAVPALLWGVAMANLIRGVPIDANMIYTGTFLDLLDGFSILAGLTSLLLFTLHGSIFLSLKVSGEVQERARKVSGWLWIPAVISILLMIIMASNRMEFAPAAITGILALLAIPAAGLFSRAGKSGTGFIFSGLAIILASAALFLDLFPNVMISTLDVNWNLDIYNAASNTYTLRVMSIVTAILLPFVLGYQGWTYWIFRKRLTTDSEMEY